MKGPVIPVTTENLVGETAKIKIEGFRFVTMSCAELADGMVDILYHFDQNLKLKHLRLTIPRDASPPSVSPVYFAAFLVENEIQDLFGVRFQSLALDYNRTLYLDEEIKETPFCRYAVSRKKQSESKE